MVIRTLKELLGRRRSRNALIAIGGLVILAMLGDFIANERPIYTVQNGESGSPLFNHMMCDLGLCDERIATPAEGWASANYDYVIFAPIPYSASTLDLEGGGFQPPLSRLADRDRKFTHWLGTDGLGRDVTAGLIRGCRIALLVGLLSMLIALIIGLPLGAMAGYLGNDRIRLSVEGILVLIVLALMGMWFVVQLCMSALNGSPAMRWYSFIGLVVVIVLAIAYRKFRPITDGSANISVAVDGVVMRIVEVIRSIPALFILFAVLAMIKNPGILAVVGLIGFLRTPTIVRYTRAETLKIRNAAFIESAQMIGLNTRQVVFRHIIPNTISPTLVTVAFGIGGAILVESALSFLGIGLGIDDMSWGRLLSSARDNFQAWWLALLPGLAIFVTVSCFNVLGEEMNKIFKMES